MRDYGKISPNYWTGETGKTIRKAGVSAQLLGAYLMTNGNSNSIGIYYLPIPLIAHETALGIKGVQKGLRSLSEAGFAYYDEKTEHVFVPNMARYQIGENLTEKDNRSKHAQAEFDKAFEAGQVQFCQQFYEMYGGHYHIDLTEKMSRAFEGASKGGGDPFEGGISPPVSPPLSKSKSKSKSRALQSPLQSPPSSDSEAEPSPPTILLPLKDGTEFTVDRNLSTELCALYPDVDVGAELRHMRAWCMAKPKKRKTKQGIMTFITNWLKKEQKEARASPSANGHRTDSRNPDDTRNRNESSQTRKSAVSIRDPKEGAL